MFSFRAYIFVIFVIFAVFANTVYSEDEPTGNKAYAIRGLFTETRSTWNHGFLKGNFYYFYDGAHPEKSRLRLEYTLTVPKTYNTPERTLVISNLHHFEDAAVYSMSPEKCTGLKNGKIADPWWNQDDLYTKTTEENGMYWYTRNPAKTNSTSYVKALLMKEDSTEPSDGYLGTVVIFDGGANEETRTLTLTDVVVDNTLNSENSLFKPVEGCPQATCPILADIVFVLDSSGSVTHLEWQETVKFVNLISDLFTFGDKAVAAAVVQFNGQDDGCKNKSKIRNDPKCGTKDRYLGDCIYPNRKSPIKPDLMTTVLAGDENEGGLTVSTNKDKLMRALNLTVRTDCAWPPNNEGNMAHCQAFSGWRGTCQALGLKNAMEVLSRSPRRHYKTKPINIVIVVTDGEDKYPNMTARNATILINDYDATLIEVGVGLECEYDKEYLKSIASKISGEPYYFDASDYSQIKKVADELFTPVCDRDFSTECGKECKGFCGAGDCYCPDCMESGDICHFINCNVSGGYSEGCVVLEEECDEEECPENVCNTYFCDPDVDTGAAKSGEWAYTVDPCKSEHDLNPGVCHNIFCDGEWGGCRVELNQSMCDEYGKGKCEQWECTPVNETTNTDTTDPSKYDAATGCRLKTNYHQDCEDQLGSRSACIKIICDPNSVDMACSLMEYDTCVEKNNACWNYACEDLGDGSYGCVARETAHIQDTNCVTWKCDNETGWDIKLDRTQKDYCKNRYAAQHPGDEDATKCKDFMCDPFSEDLENTFNEGGCYFKEKEGCSYRCTDEFDNECLVNASKISSVSQCINDFCTVHEHKNDEGETVYDTVCASELGKHSFEDCLDVNSNSYKEAKKRNEENPNVCFTPYCEYGKCGIEEVRKGADMVATKCMEPRCFQNDDGSWEWRMAPTELNKTCQSDSCFSRECHPVDGCVATDICTVNSNECYTYTCETENGARTCAMKNLTKDFQDLECMHEVCEAGKKVTYYTDCVSEDKCMKGSCVKGYCEFNPVKAPGNDLCMQYTCNPKTGNWTIAPQCDDGLFCTIDECWNYITFIECHHNTIDCSPKLRMEGYDCFVPACKENPTNQTYRCTRKLLANAYIDICGVCIKNIPDEDASDESQNMRVSCTNAPPKPLMVESLAAATIGIIIIAAIVAGAAVTTSTVIGTKTLIERVRQANNQSAVSNPLYEGCETELSNPTYGNGIN